MLCATICEYLDEQDIVCRWGGEEILLLLSDTRLEPRCRLPRGCAAQLRPRRLSMTEHRLYYVTMGVSAAVTSKCIGFG
jgi:PleD family two-component response regulator